jgi:acetoin utilization protein AcuC
MDEIHEGFQPEGRLYRQLDESTPFRAQDHWNSVRGRAWAIHDGILDAINARWDGLRMIKQVGRNAGADTFPGGEY